MLQHIFWEVLYKDRKTLLLFNVSESCFIENACSAFSWPHPYFKHTFPWVSSKYRTSYSEQVILQFTCVGAAVGLAFWISSYTVLMKLYEPRACLIMHVLLSNSLLSSHGTQVIVSCFHSCFYLFLVFLNHTCELCLESKAFAFVLDYIDITKMVITRSNLHFFQYLCLFHPQKPMFSTIDLSIFLVRS